MLIAVVLALLVASGAPWPAAVAVALAVLHPGWFLVAAAGWAVLVARRRSGSGPDDEAAFLRGLAAELGAGSGLRGGVVAAAGRVPGIDLGRAVRLCAAGGSALDIGSALGGALPVNRTAIAAAFRLAARTGAPIAPLIETLAGRADDVGRLERERRAATAQARLSAWIVGGLPVALVALALITGVGPGAGGLGTAGTTLVAAGLGLIAAGAAVVALMARRAAR